MIRVEVEDCCQRCRYFDAESIGPDVLFENGKVVEVSDTIIKCANASFCETLRKYLEEHADER